VTKEQGRVSINNKSNCNMNVIIKKAGIMLFGLLLIIVLSGIWCFFLGIFIRSSYVTDLIGNAVLYSLGGMYVGWKIKTPSWGDAIVFGAVCVVIITLLVSLLLHRSITAWTIASLVSVFAGGVAGVLFSGYLARKFQKSVRSNNSSDGK